MFESKTPELVKDLQLLKNHLTPAQKQILRQETGMRIVGGTDVNGQYEPPRGICDVLFGSYDCEAAIKFKQESGAGLNPTGQVLNLQYYWYGGWMNGYFEKDLKYLIT